MTVPFSYRWNGLVDLFEMPATPAEHKPIVHKKTTRFNRIQSSLHVRVKPSWRLTRGIDSRFRKQTRGTPKHPSIGYGTDNETKFMLPSGFIPVVVRTVKDLDMLLTKNTTHCAVISHQCGGLLRRQIEKKAEELDINVANAGYRMKAEEQK